MKWKMGGGGLEMKLPNSEENVQEDDGKGMGHIINGGNRRKKCAELGRKQIESDIGRERKEGTG